MRDMRFPMQPLSELAIAIKDGTHGTHLRVAKGVPLLSAKNITANGEIAWDETDDLISEIEYQDLNRSFRLEPDDLLLTIVGSLGRRAIYSGESVTFQRSVAYVRPHAKKLLSQFLFHWMGHPEFSAELIRRSNATAQAGLYLGELSKVSVPVPNRTEQGAIVQVLDTLDTAIHETEAIIAKLKAVKQGLLHDLLTRGIDANGELRSPQTESPHLYKLTQLGWVPREWDYLPLYKRIRRVTYGFTNPMPTTDEGPWMLTAADVSGGRIQYSTARRTSPQAFQQLSPKSRPELGDVLITKDGTLGRVAIVDQPRVCVNQSVAVLSPVSFADSIYLSTFLQSPIGQHLMMADAGGSTIKHLYITKLAEMEIPWPNESEAARIVQRVSAMNDRLDFEQQALAKLRVKKSGLMDDLLTGRVRVTPLLEAAAT